MKLLYCHIENFGKIHDFSLNFADTVHVIHEPNGWGKSTLAAFIKVMFFGFDTKRESGSFEKERILYWPWQGGVYGGELVFEVDGRTYRISRTFGRTEKTDVFHLYDCATNLECDDFSWNIGEELFDLDAASFKRSIYIGQNDCPSQTTDAINAKLGNLVENTNDINNYESAQEYLKDLSNRLSPNRATGSLKKRESRIAEVQQELFSYEAAESAVDELRRNKQLATENKERLMKKRDSYASQLKEAGEESRKQELQKTYLGLCEEQQVRLSALLPYKEIFPKGMPDEELLSAQIAKARSLEEDRNTLLHMELTSEEQEALQKQQLMFAESVPTDEEIDAQSAGIKEIADIRDARMEIEMLRFGKEKECQHQKAPEEDNLPRVSTGAVIGIQLVILGVIGAVFGIMFLHTSEFGLPLTICSAVALVAGLVIQIISTRKRSKQQAEIELRWKEWEENQRLLKEEIAELRKEEDAHNVHIQQINWDADAFLRRYQLTGENGTAANEQEMPETDGSAAGQDIQVQEEGIDTAGLYVSDSEADDDTDGLEILDVEKAVDVKADGASEGEAFRSENEKEAENRDYAEELRELKREAHEYRRLCEKSEQYEAFKASVQRKQEELHDYGQSIGQSFDEDITADLTGLATEAVKYRMAKENADAAQERLRNFEAANDTEALLRENHLPFGIDQLNANIKQIDEELEDVRSGIEQYTRQLEDLEEQLDLRDEKEQELQELVELSAKEQKLFNTVTLTQDMLQKAREQFTARYMLPVSNAFRKYFGILNGLEEEQSWQIDANIDFRMKEQGQLRETKWLSAGYQDLIGVCMRLAMVDAMYRGEKPFLLFDDPFVNLDEEKTKRGMMLLKEVSREYQILYFTCNSSREP